MLKTYCPCERRIRNPQFNIPGISKGVWCRTCKPSDAVNVVRKKRRQHMVNDGLERVGLEALKTGGKKTEKEDLKTGEKKTEKEDDKKTKKEGLKTDEKNTDMDKKKRILSRLLLALPRIEEIQRNLIHSRFANIRYIDEFNQLYSEAILPTRPYFVNERSFYRFRNDARQGYYSDVIHSKFYESVRNMLNSSEISRLRYP